ncbi:hypothetical protein G6K93_30615 [Agrobacterium rhizogenes]|nr:hypothetical protein [Rhizobium rhizogenes]
MEKRSFSEKRARYSCNQADFVTRLPHINVERNYLRLHADYDNLYGQEGRDSAQEILCMLMAEGPQFYGGGVSQFGAEIKLRSDKSGEHLQN